MTATPPPLPEPPADTTLADTALGSDDHQASRRRRRRNPQARARRRTIIVAAVVVLVFAVALVFWVRQPDGDPLPKGLSTPASSDPVVPDIGSAPSVTGSPTSTGTPTGVRAGAVPSLPALPTGSNVDVSGLPRHSVQMTVTSDGTIGFFGYVVAHGKPARYTATFLKSPVQITTVGRSNSLVAAVGGQAASDATYVTCTLTVDGKVRSTHTTRGAYTFTVCSG